MTGGIAKYWIIPRMEDKELPRAVFSILMFLTTPQDKIKKKKKPHQGHIFFWNKRKQTFNH